MEKLPNCIQCGSEFTYEEETLTICSQCAHEWIRDFKPEHSESPFIVKDAHGNILQDGDNVSIIKDIKVKGTSSVIKIGVKVKDIYLVKAVNGHNIEAKVPGWGQMMLKSEIVKKCT